MIPASVEDMLDRDEGTEHRAYGDPLTGGAPWTIGKGHTGPEVHAGLVWDDFQIDAAFQLDIAQAEQGCLDHFPWFSSLNEPRQAVLVSMAYQMGIHGLAAFVGTLACVACGDFTGAANSMRASVWAHQTPARAVRMASQMQTGEWT